MTGNNMLISGQAGWLRLTDSRGRAVAASKVSLRVATFVGLQR